VSLGGTALRRRWRFEVDRKRIGLDDVLGVAADAGGACNTLAMGTLRGVAAAWDK